MKKLVKTIEAELLHLLGDLKGYYLDYIFHNFNMYLLFLGLFYGMDKNNQSNMEITYFIIGLILWWYATTAIQSVSVIVQNEARQGTLEQVFMTKSNLMIFILCRLVAKFIFETIQMFFVILLCIVTFGLLGSFVESINYVNIIINLLITIIGLWGIGYIVAGLSMVYKKVDAVARATSNVFLFFSGLIIPIENVPDIFKFFSKLFPFYWAMESIRNTANNPQFLMGLFSSKFIVLMSISLFWFIIGVMGFKVAVMKAIKKGTVSHY